MNQLKNYFKKFSFALWFKNVLISITEKTFLYDANIEMRLFFLRKLNSKAGKPIKKRVAFYPGFPCFGFSIYKVLRALNCKMINSLDGDADAVIRWELGTYREEGFKLGLIKGQKVINGECLDISKKNVDLVFKEIFGYSSLIDPRVFNGKCVKKSNDNARHDGEIIQCPINEPDENVIYQKLLDNQIDEQFVVDLRVPIIGNNIPCICLKYRSINDRFCHIQKAELKETVDIFSADEVLKIQLFCKKIRLDYGELDVLRDRNDEKIYIIDCNNTPYGRTYLNNDDWERFFKILSRAFYLEFLDEKKSADFKY